MGRQIVYCEGCGNSLREDDFDRGKARLLENRPFCTECRPYPEGEEPPRRHSSQKVPAPPRKNATERLPIVNPPPRRPSPEKPSSPLPVIAGVGGVLLLILIVAVTRSGSPPPAPPPEKPPAPPVIERPTSRPSAEPTPPPRDPAPPVTPPAVRRDPPASKSSDPLVAPSASEKLDAFITQIKQLIQDDVRKERSTEILSMFAVASRNAGARTAEVAKLKQDYLDTLDENTRRTALWSEWKIFSTSEPGSTGLLASYGDRTSVMMTHPPDRNTPARLERDVDVPSGKKTTLTFWVSCHQQGDFELRVVVDGKEALKEIVGPKGSGWHEKKVDLSLHAGRRIAVRLENAANNWEWEHAYWHDLKITYE